MGAGKRKSFTASARRPGRATTVAYYNPVTGAFVVIEDVPMDALFNRNERRLAIHEWFKRGCPSIDDNGVAQDIAS
jgi:hypothetical protein